MNLVNKIITIITKPRWFFSHLKEQGIGQAFGMFAVLLAVSIILATFIGFLLNDYVYSLLSQWVGFSIPKPQVSPVLQLFQVIFAYVVGLIASFVIAGVLYVWIAIFGGAANYIKTYQLYAYAKVPYLLFAWIPGIGFLAGFYTLALLIIGTTEVHKLSQKKSALIFLIPVGIFLIFLILGLLLFLSFAPVIIPLMQAAIQQQSL